VHNSHVMLLDSIHVRWAPFHHGIARLQVSDESDILQIWRVAANTSDKQPWTADKRWSSSLGLGVRLRNLSVKNENVTKIFSEIRKASGVVDISVKVLC
jgi:hypothetical protein